MFAVSLLVTGLAASPVLLPRECPYCGVYAGPNVSWVTDPWLRQKDIWPEFYAASCQFEVSRGSFVTLSRLACASEATYRVAFGRGQA